MKYILEGEPLHVGHILEENARRVALGWVKFTPVTTETGVHYTAADSKDRPIADSKEVTLAPDTKSVAKKSAKKPE